MRRIILSSMAYLAVPYLCTLSHEQYDYRETILLLRWRYSPGWALASFTIRLQSSRSLALSLHSFIPFFLRSVDTSSSHLIFGLPLRLVAYSFPYNIFFGIAVSCILSIWPSHHTLWHLINLTVFSPLIMASNSSFRRILHNSFSFTGPYIFRKISLKILLMLFPLPWWVSTILNHRWPLGVPMCGISAAGCFLIWGCC